MPPPLKTEQIPFWSRALAFAHGHKNELKAQFGVSPEDLGDLGTDFYYRPEDRDGDIFVLDDKTMLTATAIAKFYGQSLSTNGRATNATTIREDAETYRALCMDWGIDKTPSPEKAFAAKLFWQDGYGDIRFVPDLVPEKNFPFTAEQDTFLAELFPGIEFEIAEPPPVSSAEKAVFGPYIHLRMESPLPLIAAIDKMERETDPQKYAQKLLILSWLTRRAAIEMLEEAIRLNDPERAPQIVIDGERSKPLKNLYLKLTDVIMTHDHMIRILNSVLFIFSQEGFPVPQEAVDAVLEEWTTKKNQLQSIQNNFDRTTANIVDVYNQSSGESPPSEAQIVHLALKEFFDFLIVSRYALKNGFKTVADFVIKSTITMLGDLEGFAHFSQIKNPLLIIPIKLLQSVFLTMRNLIASTEVGPKLAQLDREYTKEIDKQFLKRMGKSPHQRQLIGSALEQVFRKKDHYPWIEEWGFLMTNHLQEKSPENLTDTIVQLAILAKNTPRVITHYLAHRDDHLATAIQAATDGLEALALIKKYQQQMPQISFEGFEELKETLSMHQNELTKIKDQLRRTRKKNANLPVSRIDNFKPAMDSMGDAIRTLFYDLAHSMEFFSIPYAFRLIKEAQKLADNIQEAHEKFLELLPDDPQFKVDHAKVLSLSEQVSNKHAQTAPLCLNATLSANTDSLGTMDNVDFEGDSEIMEPYFITGQMPSNAFVKIIF